MSEILKWISANSILTFTLVGAFAVFIVVYVIAFFQGRELIFWPPKIGAKPNKIKVEASRQKETDKPFLSKGYPRSQHPSFFSEVERLVPKAKKIKLIATGLNLLWDKHIVDLLIDRAKLGDAEVTICFGNPFSPHVEDRLIEEEMRDNRPPVGREGIIKNVKALMERLETAGNPQNFTVLLFENYPTFATLIFDEDMFIYPYGYQILGNNSPIFHFINDGSEEALFFINNAERILGDAIPASEIISKMRNRKYFSDNWVAAAVYIIPNRNESFYQFGSSIIGYDVWTQTSAKFGIDELTDSMRPFVGEAAEYGFHATLADALFFASEAEIDRIQAELRILTEEFCPFTLSEFRIVDRSENEGDIVVLCNDELGITEAIHHELVSRFYRMSISSTFQTGKTSKKLPNNLLRSNFMIKKYGSPFILKDFNLHFTLCTKSPADPDSKKEILNKLQKSYYSIIKSDKIEISELCLVSKRSGDDKWKIESKHPLIGS